MATCPVCKSRGAERGVLCPNSCAYLVKDSALKVKANGLERYLGKVIGNRYAVVGYLGRGGMGVVYRSRDLRGTSEVALKVLISTTPSTRARRRFLREAKVAARLRHPNIVATYRFGRTETGFYMAMELVEGQPLSRFWRQGLPLDVLLEVCVQVLSGLSVAHEAEVVHRDLKPANILLSHTPHGLQVKVVDFGLARFSAIDDELTRTGELVGTPRYMSPEQARGSRDIGPATDLYALGVIIYEFITGKMLFEAETSTALAVMHLTEPTPPLVPRKGLKVPTGFEAVLRRLLSKDPKSRYVSAAALRAAITPFLRRQSSTKAALGDLSIDDKYVESTIADGCEGSSLTAVSLEGVDEVVIGHQGVYDEIWSACIQTVEAGRGAVILVSGDTGLGKSRLMGRLKRRSFEELAMDWYEGESRQGAGQALLCVRQVLSDLLGLRHEGHADARKLIQATLARWGTPAESEVNRLTRLLRPEATDAVLILDSQRGEAEEREGRQGLEREMLFGLVERVLRRAAAVRPLVIELEDLQWAREPTLQFLEYIVPNLYNTPAPLTLLGTLSSDVEGHGQWLGLLERMERYSPGGFRCLEVKRLDEESSRQFIQGLLPSSDRLVESVGELSQGNPQHITQVLKYLKEKGLIEEASGVWDLVGEKLNVDAVPPGLAKLLMGRLTSLVDRHPEGREFMAVLERCAIIGRKFPYKLLCTVLRLEEEQSGPGGSRSLLSCLDKALDLFIKEGVLEEEKTSEDEEVLAFCHDLLRELLNDNLSMMRTMRAAHRASALAKMDYFSGQLDGYAYEIAAHYESSKDWNLALPWLARAARQARSGWDLQLALKLLTKAEEELSKQRDVDVEFHCQLLEAKGEIFSAQGRYRDASACYTRAFNLAEGGGEPKSKAHLIFLKGDAARMVNDFDNAERSFRKALSVSRTISDASGVGQALLGMAKIFRIRNQLLKAHQFLTAAEEQFKLCDDQRSLADCSCQRAYVFVRSKNWKETRRHLMVALALKRQVGDEHARACIQRDLARLSLFESRVREAQLQTRKALDCFEGLGDRYGYAKTLACLGGVYYALKQYQAAHDLHNRALSIFEALESTEDIVIETFHLGMVAFRRNNPELSRELFEKAHEKANGQQSLRGIALAGQAWLASHREDIISTRTLMSRALPGLRREAFPIRELGEIYDDCADCFQRHRDLVLAEACRRWSEDVKGGSHALT